MSRIVKALALSLMFAPQALACGMYIPEEVHLADIFDEIDAPVEGLAQADSIQPNASALDKVSNIDVSPVTASASRVLDLLKLMAPRS